MLLVAMGTVLIASSVWCHCKCVLNTVQVNIQDATVYHGQMCPDGVCYRLSRTVFRCKWLQLWRERFIYWMHPTKLRLDMRSDPLEFLYSQLILSWEEKAC